MEAQTVKELHQYAKDLGLIGHWDMNKPELILFIRKSKGKRPGKPPGYTKREVLPSYGDIKDDRPPNYYLRYEAIIKYWQKIFPNRTDFKELTDTVKWAPIKKAEHRIRSINPINIFLVSDFINRKFPSEDPRFLIIMTKTLMHLESEEQSLGLNDSNSSKKRLYREMPYGPQPAKWERMFTSFKSGTSLEDWSKLVKSNSQRFTEQRLNRIKFLLNKRSDFWDPTRTRR